MTNITYDRVGIVPGFRWYCNDDRTGGRRPLSHDQACAKLKAKTVFLVEAVGRIPDDEIRAYVASCLRIWPYFGNGTPRKWPTLTTAQMANELPAQMEAVRSLLRLPSTAELPADWREFVAEARNHFLL